MRRVRTGLLVAWFVLIASLLWDPLTPLLTMPDHRWSPFHIGAASAQMQGAMIESAPYPMGARMFWTMVLPLVPLFLMSFGHEAWRRVCPLSHASQLPGRFGWRRRLRRLNRSTGQVDRLLALMPSRSWLAANHLYFQFAFLSLGVLGRLLFYNSDRAALAVTFLLVIAFAFTVGLLYGGKTWCNYFCPVAVIQGIYTGPGGLFDSKAHVVQRPVSQSMCRTPGPNGDQSACVGCKANCSDVDLENSYWKSLESNQTRVVYYGFFGLVFAFYTYYFVYSGGWSYYMSGVWTHEPGQLQGLFAPGLYLFGTPIPIPKIVAAPLYFAACIAIAYALFAQAERLYARATQARGLALTTTRLRHHMLSVCAFLTINLFYWFAGRPNIRLMPDWAAQGIDATILVVSVIWLGRTLARDPDMYNHERLARTLRAQLERMGFRSEELLDGQPIDKLTADEIYVLAKTLPNFSAAQKREAYQAVLAEALETGHTQSAESLRLLSDLRAQLRLSDADHHAITEALHVQDPTLLDPKVSRSAEMHACRSSYRKFLLDHAEQGDGVDALSALRPARALLNLSEDDHAHIAGSVADSESQLIDRAERALDALGRLEAARFSLRFAPAPETKLLRHTLLLKQRVLARDVANVAAAIEDDRVARSLAQSLYAVLGRQSGAAVAEVMQWATPERRAAITQMTDDPVLWSYFEVIEAAPPPAAVFAGFATDRDPLIAALAIVSLEAFDRLAAEAAARDLTGRLDSISGAVRSLVDEVLMVMRHGTRSDIVAVAAGLVTAELFTALDPEALAEIARRSALVTFSRGEQICRPGDVTDWMFVLVEGETQVLSAASSENRIIGRHSEGAVFGEIGMLAHHPHMATVEVSSEAATAVAIPRAVIDELLGRDGHAARDMLAVVAGYLLDRLAEPVAAVETAELMLPEASYQ